MQTVYYAHICFFLLPVAVVVQIEQFVQHVHMCVCVSGQQVLN